MLKTSDLSTLSKDNPRRDILDEAYTIGTEVVPDDSIPSRRLSYVEKVRKQTDYQESTYYDEEILPRLVSLMTALEEETGADDVDCMNDVYTIFDEGFFDTMDDDINKDHLKLVYTNVPALTVRISD